ncbi:tetratricopeptide repeat protein 32-like [Uloborus diversus]|uniref:tetratricopeptide repeat protein 32-like n=1 Tax=Uloborus diversus TaxID=327109 RepID=UPI00240A14AD|nr:tetratricopeptide repeat protein 32-like [Uloborus diversus]
MNGDHHETVSQALEEARNLIDERKYLEAENRLSALINFLENEPDSIKRNRFLSEAYNNLGQVFYRKVEFDRAVGCYGKATELKNDFAAAFYNRGTIQYRLGFYASALEDMRKAVTLDPLNVEFVAGLRATEEASPKES